MRARRLAGVLSASVLSGVALGLAARLAMRFVALESGLDVGFSVGGSLEVIAFGVLAGAPCALVFLLARRRLATAALWPGLACGVLVFLGLWLVRPPAAQSALAGTPDTPAATFAAFAVVFAAWGMGLELVSRRMPSSSRPAA
jgi:hypothetical protein